MLQVLQFTWLHRGCHGKRGDYWWHWKSESFRILWGLLIQTCSISTTRMKWNYLQDHQPFDLHPLLLINHGTADASSSPRTIHQSRSTSLTARNNLCSVQVGCGWSGSFNDYWFDRKFVEHFHSYNWEAFYSGDTINHQAIMEMCDTIICYRCTMTYFNLNGRDL